MHIQEYLRCMGLEKTQIALDKEGIRIKLKQTVSQNESEECLELKAWTESEVRGAALEVQLQIRYWEEEQKRKAAIEERMKQ